jgi:hypothetical protein
MHTVPIMRVFLTGRYEADINTVNPLGLKGQLAMALGNLINSVWRVSGCRFRVVDILLVLKEQPGVALRGQSHRALVGCTGCAHGVVGWGPSAK